MHRDTLRKLFDAAVPYVLPLPALAGFTLLSVEWPGYLAGLAALGYLLWQYGADGLGQQRLTRCLLVAVGFVAVARFDGGLDVSLALAGGTATAAPPRWT